MATPNVPAPGPSTFLNRLAALTKDEPCHDAKEERDRPSASSTDAALSIATQHNEDLMIVEDMGPGPYKLSLPLDDPNFDHLEPHSGIV
ncbi:hypothetical protein M378DRAFT_15785 [Amanita muscaria Koide BX008]|uniref:Uncharacterized protein n=1 Tax=Amanita muscaria (strain Koide BX008) TaxID=946122 RepID=A0A0C2WPE0_AMAMK|nr:hypothetical protein M378DRAFT_15785 [Amanita muscaria Koide BX008]